MSTSAALNLFPSDPSGRLSEENIRKITEQALETVQARNQASRQAIINPKTPEMQNSELPQSPLSIKSSGQRAKSARILESPMDRNYATALGSKTPESARSSPSSAISSSHARIHGRKLSRVDSIRSETSTYSNDEPRSTLRFSSPTTRTNSPAFSEASTALNTSPSSSNESPVHLRSMFPTYDSRQPLMQQYNNPQKMPKIDEYPSRNPSRSQRRRIDIYSSTEELQTLWGMANGQKIEKRSKPFRLQMHHRYTLKNSDESTRRQNSIKNMPLISFGLSAENPFFSVYSSSDTPNIKSHVEVRRHTPTSKGASIPVADFCLAKINQSFPTNLGDSSSKLDDVTTSFTPKLATLLALESVNEVRKAESTSSSAYENALTASKLTTQALQAAERKHSSIILSEPLSGDYLLCHPAFGLLPLQVSGQIRIPSSPDANIDAASTMSKTTSPNAQNDARQSGMSMLKGDPSLNSFSTLADTSSFPDSKPSTGSGSVTLWASSDTSTTKRRAIASLNFENSTLTLHPSALEDLADLFVVDTVVCSLVAVALAEIRRKAAVVPISPPTFPAPPTRALSNEKTRLRSLPKGKWSLEIRNADGQIIGDEPIADLPIVTRGIVKGVNVAAQTVTVLVGVAAKLTTGTVVRASRAYSKR